MIVFLDQAEIMIAATLGEMRHKVAVDAGYYRQLGATPEDDIAADRNGIMGEIAFGKAFNLFVDLTFTPRRAGWDFNFRGKHIDVKTTAVEGKPLTIDRWKMDRHGHRDVDIFVLAQILPQGNAVDLVGFVGVQEFKDNATLSTYGNGKEIYTLDRLFLSPTEWLETQF